MTIRASKKKNIILLPFFLLFFFLMVTMDHLTGNWDMLTLGVEFVKYECLSMTIDKEKWIEVRWSWDLKVGDAGSRDPKSRM
jgi:hypothetical protein